METKVGIGRDRKASPGSKSSYGKGGERRRKRGRGGEEVYLEPYKVGFTATTPVTPGGRYARVTGWLVPKHVVSTSCPSLPSRLANMVARATGMGLGYLNPPAGMLQSLPVIYVSMRCWRMEGE